MRDHIAYESAPDRVAALLAAAAAPAEAPVPGEAEALVAFRAVMASPVDRQRRSMKTRATTKLVAAGALSILTFAGGGYAMAATTLPEQAADAAATALAAVGLGGPDDGAADSATTHTKSAKATTHTKNVKATEHEGRVGAEVTANDHGQAVSSLAKTTTLEGRAKGEAISTEAKKQGVAQRAAAEARRTSAGSQADDASSQGATKSSTGRTTATMRSSGASTAGAGNADTERP